MKRLLAVLLAVLVFGGLIFAASKSLSAGRAASKALRRLDVLEPKLEKAKFDPSPLEERLATGASRDSNLQRRLLVLGNALRLQRLQANPERLRRVQEALDAIKRELSAFGKGDWREWNKALEPCRKEVEDLVLAKKLISRDGLDWDSFMQRAVLEDPNESEPGSGKPSPIEVLLDFANQVEARGVDFIYVPIPDKIEVYPEDFVEGPVPSNGIVTPNSRRFLATLLEDGIEVVDLYPVFRANRDRGCYLYLADHHFSPAGARLAAEAVCERLRRYELPRRQSISSAGIFDAVPVDPAIPKSLRWRWEKFSFPNGTPYEDVADSPVLIVGDSNLMLANCFPEHGACFAEKGGGFSACLAAKLGFPLSLYAVPQFTPMLLSRGPKGLLRGRRALVMVHTIVQWNEGRANLRLAELPSDW